LPNTKFKVGDIVRVTTDEASAAVLPGTILQVGLIETVDNKDVYYLYGGDDWGFAESDLEIATANERRRFGFAG